MYIPLESLHFLNYHMFLIDWKDFKKCKFPEFNQFWDIWTKFSEIYMKYKKYSVYFWNILFLLHFFHNQFIPPSAEVLLVKQLLNPVWPNFTFYWIQLSKSDQKLWIELYAIEYKFIEFSHCGGEIRFSHTYQKMSDWNFTVWNINQWFRATFASINRLSNNNYIFGQMIIQKKKNDNVWLVHVNAFTYSHIE